jgi:hypothetical protein
MRNLLSPSDRASTIAKVLRPLGKRPLSREQAARAAQLLWVHWTTVYRLRARFLADAAAAGSVDTNLSEFHYLESDRTDIPQR